GVRKFLDICGPANTAEIFFVGRNMDADRAAQIGLVNHVVEAEELEEASLSMAAEIAANAPLSLKGNKRILRALRDVPQKLLADARTYPDWWVPTYKESAGDGPPEVGRVSHQRFGAKLPYTLKTESKIVAIDRPRTFEVDVVGDLRGHGKWTLTPEDGKVHVR